MVGFSQRSQGQPGLFGGTRGTGVLSAGAGRGGQGRRVGLEETPPADYCGEAEGEGLAAQPAVSRKPETVDNLKMKFYTRLLVWLNANWNKRRTTAAERNLGKLVKQQAEQIEDLQNTVAQMQDRLDDEKSRNTVTMRQLQGENDVLSKNCENLTELVETQMELRRREIGLLAERNGHANN